MNYADYLNAVAKKRKPSAIRALQPLLRIPGMLLSMMRVVTIGMISLGGGMPHPSTFPFSKLSFTLQNGEKVELTEQETSKALQYSQTNGIPEFLDVLKDLQTKEHKPPSEFDICVTNGSQEGISKVSYHPCLNC